MRFDQRKDRQKRENEQLEAMRILQKFIELL